MKQERKLTELGLLLKGNSYSDHLENIDYWNGTPSKNVGKTPRNITEPKRTRKRKGSDVK